jgi:hypothetical protein
MFNWKTRECVQQVFMPNFESREVLVCLRVDEAGIPPTPSFNCQCELCGARIWVAHNSAIEPARICATCSTARDAQVSRLPLHRLDAN